MSDKKSVTETGYISVAATRNGFWRAKRQWGAEPRVVAVSDFTAEELRQLQADPAIIVQAAPKPSGKDKGEGK